MAVNPIPQAKQIDRVPSMTVPLDSAQNVRFQNLAEEVTMVDVHQHPFILPEDMGLFIDYLRTSSYSWGYAAVKHGGWSTVTTSNVFRALLNAEDMSFVEYDDVLGEVNMMLADINLQKDVVKVGNANDILAAKQQGKLGFMPTLEHLAIGSQLSRVDTLYNVGVRLAGLTYFRKNYIGDGMYERNDGGLSDFGIEVVHRMNDLGMAVDLSHASFKTAMDAIEFSKTPVIFSHNASYTLRPVKRTRKDEELLACAKKGGLIAITAVPNSLSDDPEQTIECVLDHYVYMTNLVGIDHVGIGTDTVIGDHVGFHKHMMARDAPREFPAEYLSGLESPADGKNIIRGLISRGYSDEDVMKITGGNALDFFRRVMT